MNSRASNKNLGKAIFNSLNQLSDEEDELASKPVKSADLNKYFLSIQQHLRRGASPNARDENDDTYITNLFGQNVSIPYKKFHLILEVFLKAGTNPNLRNNDGDTALHLLLDEQSPAAENYTGPQIVSLIELLVKYNANPNIRNKAGETVFSTDKTDYHPNKKIDWEKIQKLFLFATYPQAKEWSEKQHTSRIQSILLAHSCGLNLKHITSDPSQPDPEHWFDKYKKLNTIYNDRDEIIGHRTKNDAASHAKDMLTSMTKSFLIAPLIKHYPRIIPILNNDVVYDEDDTEEEIETEEIYETLTYTLGKVLFAPRFKTNTPGIALTKILEMVNRWDRNRAEIDKNLPFLGLSWDALTPTVQAPNGLWLVPLTTENALKKEGDTLKHCVAGYKKECAFENLHVIGIRYQAEQPAYTAGIKLKREKVIPQDPLGYKNAKPKQDIQEAYNWYKNNLENGMWGSLERKSIIFKKNADNRRKNFDTLTVDIGYNPRGTEGMAIARQCWHAWIENMDDLLRYRKLDLDTMLANSDLITDFDKIAYRAGITTKLSSNTNLRNK